MKEIAIYDFIGEWGYGPKDLRADLEDHEGPVSILMNSEGGDVFAGQTMFEILSAFEGHITLTVQGVAASIASVIALAADRVLMAAGARFMIHDPWTVAVGDANDMLKTANLLASTKQQLIKYYQTRMKGTREEIAAAMSEETWYTSEEAIEAGLADDVLELPAAPANVSRHAPHIAKRPADLVLDEAYQAHADQVLAMSVRTLGTWKARQIEANRQRTIEARRSLERIMTPAGTLARCQARLDNCVPKT